MKYTVIIKETLEKAITISAENEEVAQKIVKKMYFDEEIILDADDFVDVEFKAIMGEEYGKAD